MREIGGYIEFETYKGTLFHDQAIGLNSGRNCLAFLLRARNIKKIALPYFLCDSVMNLCQKEQVGIRYYQIDETLLPCEVDLQQDEWLYVVNYYGQLSQTQLQGLVEKYERVIVDNAQAYFQMPLPGVDTIYTCRKFFGVSDGAFLYTDALLDQELPTDESFEHMHFLMGRYERTASEFYQENVNNNGRFAKESLKWMSKLTQNLLRGIDYQDVKATRTQNYTYLHEQLKDLNLLSVQRVEGAFAYPLLLENGNQVRKELQKCKIYIPTLWPNVLAEGKESDLEYRYAKNILPIPCDQRYGITEMEYMCDKIKEITKR